MHRACAKAGSHPAATANVRGYTVRREGGITEADLTISTIYEAVPCFEQLSNVSGPPTQFVLIGGLSVGAVHCRGGFFTHYTEVHTMQLSAPAPSLGQSGVRIVRRPD